MAAKNGVVDTSVFKGIADLHAGVMSDDPVVAPAHEVVHDSDMVADLSMPSDHGDAAADHSGDTASTSTEDASAGDAGHVHADLAYSDVDHAYADADHAYADVDHAYADHAYADADATALDSAVSFSDHPMLLADDGMPHSLGADTAKGQGDDGHDAAAWAWAGGAAVGGVGLGILLSHDNHEGNSSSGSSDVHVVVERGGAYIDTDHDGVYEDGAAAAVFGAGGNASLLANDVTIHFNDVPLDALNLTGFGELDKIEFHVEAMIGNGVLSNASSGSRFGQYLHDVNVDLGDPNVEYTLARMYGGGSNQLGIHQHDGSGLTDFAGNTHNAFGGYLWADCIANYIQTTVSEGYNSHTYAAIAYWSDTNNALNDNSHVIPNYVGTTHLTSYTWSVGTGKHTSWYTTTVGNSSVVRDNLNANNEGGLVDFIWPSGADANI